MRYRLRWALMMCAFLGALVTNVNAVDFTWNDGDIVSNTVVYSDLEGLGAIQNVLDINGDIAIRGDVTISNTNQMTSDTDAFYVNINQDSFIHTDSGAAHGHLIFYNDECCQTIVWVDNDLIFTGSNYGDGILGAGVTDNRELTLTFSGPGQTVFKLGCGKQVGFEGFFGDGSQNGWSSYWDDYTKTGSGVMVYITMDQNYAQAIEQGRNKVIFERYYYYDDTLFDPSLSCTNESVKISVGKNSFITYLSDVDSGSLSCCDFDTALGYGTMAFDPMCYGPGRMLLHIKGCNFLDSTGTFSGLPHAYNDGALVVAGHYVEDYTTPDGIRLGVYLNQPAGVEALFRIIDERAWADANGYYQSEGDMQTHATTGEPIIYGGPNAGRPSRRGLLVVNECKSIPSYAADTYVNNQWANSYVYVDAYQGSTPIRPGFILGINGCMELFHNTFLDYIAASTMGTNTYELDWEGTKVPITRRKKHNPSALTVDGLAFFDLTNFDPADPYGNPEDALHYPYEADAASLGGRHAQILLRGDSRLYMRSGVAYDGAVDNYYEWYTTPSSLGGYISGLDRLYSFTINVDDAEGLYDGSFMAGYAATGGMYLETTGEGNNVLDIEGKLTIRSTDDKNSTNDAGFVLDKVNSNVNPGSACYYNRHIPTNELARGVLNAPPIKIDYMGREVNDDTSTIISRPLTINTFYPCYNSSSFQLNNEMALHNVHWHHNDVLKIATPEQDKSEPAVVGGEKAAYDYYYWSTLTDEGLTDTAEVLFVENPTEAINRKVPLVSLFTTTCHLHESLVASGVRFVVTDKFWYEPDNALGHAKLVKNWSTLMCYNHGDQLDMLKRGYGRTFMLGSQQNKMADGLLSEDYLKNGYINIYRGWNTDGNATDLGNGDYLVRLSLETDAQPRYTIQYETRDDYPSGSNAYSKLLEWGVDPYKRVATQVVFLGNASYSSVGWTTTEGDQVIAPSDLRPPLGPTYDTDGVYSYSFGINEGLRPRPWDGPWGLGDYLTLDGGPIEYKDFKFSLTSEANDRAELYVNGDNYYFGGRDTSGNLATEGVVASNESCIFYTNHGGRTHINQTDLSVDQGHHYDCFVDTIFAYRPWPRIRSDKTDSTSALVDGLSGIVDFPHDQVKFGRSIQPYYLDFTTLLSTENAQGQLKENNVRLSVYDAEQYGASPANRKKASGEEVTIAWNFRTDKSTRIGMLESAPTFTSVKSPTFGSERVLGIGKDRKAEAFRHIVDPRTTLLGEDLRAVAMPDAMLTVSTGDVITQMRISGATKADPFHLYATGGNKGYSVVREFTSLTSNYFNPGEGCHGAILMDGGAHIGIGTRDWNEHSNNAWSILGYDYLTLYPNGNCFVWVNSDIIIADRLAIIPTTNFGSYDNDLQVLINRGKDQRITFYSKTPREIRIPEGGELDLSAFGSPGGTVDLEDNYPQQIEFAGKIRLIFEPGSRLRFPSSPDYEPVLYMNDETSLVFEGAEDRDREEFSSLIDSDDVRSKITGVGQIWLNKFARMRVEDTSFVGVETDDETDTTYLTISLQRQAQFLIGDDNVSGGNFQIGNPVNRSGHSIQFILSLVSEEAVASIRREGFLGLAAGIIRKGDAINGDANDKCWSLQRLYNVDAITLNVENGTFDHNQIYDGSNRRTSLMAIGPCDDYNVVMGTRGDATIKGGGNILFIGADADADDPYPGGTGLNTTIIGSTASIAGGTTGDYNILAPDRAIRQIRSGTVPNGTGTVVVNASLSGADAQGFYNYLRLPAFDTTYPASTATDWIMPKQYVAFGQTELDLRIGYIAGGGTTITRAGINSLDDESNPEDSLRFGAAASASSQARTTLNAVTRSY